MAPVRGASSLHLLLFLSLSFLLLGVSSPAPPWSSTPAVHQHLIPFGGGGVAVDDDDPGRGEAASMSAFLDPGRGEAASMSAFLAQRGLVGAYEDWQHGRSMVASEDAAPQADAWERGQGRLPGKGPWHGEGHESGQGQELGQGPEQEASHGQGHKLDQGQGQEPRPGRRRRTSGDVGSSAVAQQQKRPTLVSVFPATGSPEGGQVLTVKGTAFSSTEPITVYIGATGRCVDITVISSTELRCTNQRGVGGPLPVVVKVGTTSSDTVAAFSYAPPSIESMSRSWVVDGTRLALTGRYFVSVEGSLKCRLGSAAEDGIEMEATVVDDNNMVCSIQTASAISSATSAAAACVHPELGCTPDAYRSKQLYVSNDNGDRWSSAIITLLAPLRWYNGSGTVPLAHTPIPLYKSIVVAVMLPSKAAFPFLMHAAAAGADAVNEAGIFPGSRVVLEYVERQYSVTERQKRAMPISVTACIYGMPL